MQEGWNKNMAAHFEPPWSNVLDESIQECINRYNCPGWMFVPCKPHPFGDNYHIILCAKYKVIYNIEIVEGKDLLRVMGKKEFEEKGATDCLMVTIKNPLWGTVKVLVMDSVFCVLEGFISMSEKGVLGLALIKKRSYWPKGVPEEDILWRIQNKEVGDVDTV